MTTREEAVEKFRLLCVKLYAGGYDDEFMEDLDWYAMSVGFFLALGLDKEDACDLAAYVRYELHYWEDWLGEQ